MSQNSDALSTNTSLKNQTENGSQRSLHLMVLHSTTEINVIIVKYLLHCAGIYSHKSGTIVEHCCGYDSPTVDFERNVAEFKLDVKILFYCLELWKKSFKATSTLCCCNDLRERSKSLLISPLATPS